jgi:hypothetical protein
MIGKLKKFETPYREAEGRSVHGRTPEKGEVQTGETDETSLLRLRTSRREKWKMELVVCVRWWSRRRGGISESRRRRTGGIGKFAPGKESEAQPPPTRLRARVWPRTRAVLRRQLGANKSN